MKNLINFVLFSFALTIHSLFAADKVEFSNGRVQIVHQEMKKLQDFTDQDFITWEFTAAKMENVFQQVFSLGDYFRLIPLTDLSLPAKMVMIPVGSYDHDKNISIFWEIKNTLAIVGGELDGLPRLSLTQVQQLSKATEHIALHELKPLELIPGDYFWVDGYKGLQFMLQNWKKRFKANHPDQIDPFKDIDLTSFEKSKDAQIPTTLGKKLCTAFCNPEVIQRQKIDETADHFVLINNRPYTDQEHLLIIPKVHMQKISFQTPEMIVSKYHLILKLVKALKKIYPDKEIVLATKNGWKANQTQNHLHDHLIVYDAKAAAPWMKNWIVEIVNLGKKQNPPLTTEEIKARGQKILQEYPNL